MARILESRASGGLWRRPHWLGGPPDASPADGRLADAALFAFAVALGGVTQGFLWQSRGVVVDAVDVAAGAVACLALWWRRAHPMAVFVIAAAASTFSPLASGAGLVVLGTAASRLRGRALVVVVLLTAVVSVVFPLINPTAGEIVNVGFPAFLLSVIAFGWGLYLRARRELVASLQERAERLAADQRRAAGQAREAERRRIAREMHDVLAHRLSLLSVHAGALEFHPDAQPDEIARAAAVIRTSAAAALSDLRQVITVLREDSAVAGGPPGPGFGQLGDLLEESRSAGMTLDARIELPGTSQFPETVGRTAYRVVQEGLTNARKHAADAPVQVTVTADDQAVTAEVISRRALAGPGAAAPAETGAENGAGLIGLAERVTLAGGQLEHGPNAIGDFVLRATIPRQA